MKKGFYVIRRALWGLEEKHKFLKKGGIYIINICEVNWLKTKMPFNLKIKLETLEVISEQMQNMLINVSSKPCMCLYLDKNESFPDSFEPSIH